MKRTGRCIRPGRWRGAVAAILAVLVTLLVAGCAHVGSGADPRLNEQIQEVAGAYVDAFNRADADALAELWTEDGEFVNQTTGSVVKGRSRILRTMKRAFAREPGMEAENHSLLVKPVAADVAVAQGLSQFTPKTGSIEAAAFVALYVKRGGAWKIHRIWQTELDPDPHHEHLADLAWMIGEWTEEKEGRKTSNVCRWTRNRNFITRSFEVSDATGVLGKGTEVIGWDPAAGCVRSWTFDAQGGFAGCVWEKADGRWRPGAITDHKPEALARHQEALKELEWMVGRWASRGEDVSVESSCRWASSRAFLLRRFRASSPGRWEHEGLSVIGWDPREKRIRSWMFDTDGGYAESIWTRDGDSWVSSTRHVLPDGGIGSSVMLFKQDGKDAMIWQRISQEVNGEVLPGGPEVRLTREPRQDNGT